MSKTLANQSSRTTLRPLIGLPVSPPERGSPYYNLNPEYTNAVNRAGGDPLAFPLLASPTYVNRMIELIHGLILIGSAYDLDPARYGQKAHPNLKRSDTARDDFDRLLLERAYERALPILGICHGCQAINVFTGGSLVQDIQSQISGALQHRTSSETGEYAHEVELLLHTTLNPEATNLSVMTNSAHDQAIEHLGRGLRAIGHTSDGVIEAFEEEDVERHFVLGVQWHPERLSATDPISFRVFEKTVAAAAAWKNEHEVEF
ncbi:MAG: gamma-glutamyl-gamma-aminobutyrate hydrolase family protein [Fidelibacterota bacterium]|nr:MAG: gamma-glutamyl-gamma-aminobutyrate hydrolase family protein [Candidatus Neomarinimicrobiota bacterium]